MISRTFNQIFVTLLAGACLLVSYAGGRFLTWSDVWTVLLGITSFLTTLALRKEEEHNPEAERLTFLQIGVLAFSVLAVLLWRSLSLSLWLDELSQFQNVDLLEHGLSLVRSAADQQQPPLDLYFQYLSQFVFGPGEFTLRFFPIIFFIGSIINLGSLLRSVSNSRSLVFLGIVLFVFNPLISYFSAEARPYSLAIYLGVVFLHYLNKYRKKAETSNLIQLTIFGSLLISSIGLQPLFIVFASIGMLFVNSKSQLERKKLLLAGLTLGLGALVTYWPILSNSVDIEKIGFVSLQDWSDVDLWLKVFSSYLALSNVNAYSITLSVFIILSLGIALFRIGKDSNSFFEIFSILIISTLTALCFIFFINWPYYQKFSIVSFTLIPLLIAKAVGEVLKKLRRYEKVYRALEAVVVWVPLAFIAGHFVTQKSAHLSRAEDWRTFQLEMSEYGNSEIKAFSFLDHHLPPIHTLFGSKVYLSNDEYTAIDNVTFRPYFRNVTDLRSQTKSDWFVFAMPRTWSQDDVDPLVANSLKFGSLKGHESFRFWASERSSDASQFMWSLGWIYAGQPWSFSVLESLLMFNSGENNTNMRLRIEKELWSLINSHRENGILGVKSLGEKQKEFYNNYLDELKSHVR